MAVHTFTSTSPGGVTPVCGECGVSLCWDISDVEYLEDKSFWDAWVCEVCNKGKPFTRKYFYGDKVK